MGSRRPSPPATLPVRQNPANMNLEAIPHKLKRLPHWLGWRWETVDGRKTKAPYMIAAMRKHAKSTDPATWASFEAAARGIAAFDGIGFALEGSGLAAIDLDHCRNAETGELTELARSEVERFQSYTEVTPSGTGLRIIVEGQLPEGKGRVNRALDVEVYDRGRYVTVTGDHLAATPTGIEPRQAELDAFLAERFSPLVPPVETGTPAPLQESDQELLVRAKSAANGGAFSALYAGQWQGRYPSHSEADLALCCHLAFWTRRDPSRMDALFRGSGLCRKKWTDRKDYREQTIAKACDLTPEVYSPSDASEAAPPPTDKDAPVTPADGERAATGPPARPMLWTTATELATKVAEVTWLWPDWLPRGFLTILAAAPGDGKSAVALDLANRLIQGVEWPDESPNEAGGGDPVLVIDAEGCQAIWCARIALWGVPGDKMLFPGDGFARVALDDLHVREGVRETILDLRTKLLIIDSLRGALPGAVDENDSRIASVLSPWTDLARDTNVALLVVHHFGKPKKGEGRSASPDRLRGSSAIAAAARVVVAADHPQEESREDDPTMRLSVVKSNLAALPKPLGFCMGPEGVDWCDAPQPPRRETVADRAADFLRAVLAKKPMPYSEVMEAATSAHVSKRGLYEAKKRLRIVDVPNPENPRKPLWSLPTERGAV